MDRPNQVGGYGRAESALSTMELARTPQVTQELQAQAQSLDELHAALSGLEDRLATVLQPTAPQGTPDPGKGDLGLVKLAHTLQDRRLGIEGATNRVRSLLQRLEL